MSCFGGGDHLEGGVFHLFHDGSTANALGANSHRFVGSICGRDSDGLEVRLKSSSRNPGYFRSDSAEILRFTAGGDTVSDASSFPTYFTHFTHCDVFLLLVAITNEFVFRAVIFKRLHLKHTPTPRVRGGVYGGLSPTTRGSGRFRTHRDAVEFCG